MGIFDFFDALFNSEEYKDVGSSGERFTYRELKDTFEDDLLFRNVYLKKRDNTYTEIDLIKVCSVGLLVFESKNYSGWIFGNDKQSHWTQCLQSGQKNRLYNPVWQNNAHINCLKYHFREYTNLAYHSFVVFSERCELKKIECDTPDTYVLKRDDLFWKVRKVCNQAKRCLTENEIEQISRYLSKAERPNDDIKEQHIKNIKTNANKCPKCKNELVERTNRQNGNKFYGCKSYPNCTYTTKNIREG